MITSTFNTVVKVNSVDNSFQTNELKIIESEHGKLIGIVRQIKKVGNKFHIFMKRCRYEGSVEGINFFMPNVKVEA